MSNNKIADVLSFCGVVSVLFGVVSSLVMFGNDGLASASPSLPPVFGLSALASGFISGILFFGFAEVIKLLQGIYNQGLGVSTPEPGSSNLSNESIKEVTTNLEGIDPEDEHEIKLYFGEKNQTINSIVPTDEVGVYLVDVEGEKKKVEAGGFVVRVID
ncbi:hypothetical protein [Halobacillus sp. BBL2006]|uniref:hypothetical protein n=1 Tax=Halobacillus sp. BBL2006 TaxID=1543706 RepID=UPI0005424A76|nr:hypothetical protein [Halobacillus sp. BBL2006]KHE72471.1 hypothetical protein LD39_04395 [Halobacillus sp. BBL2006]